MFKNSMKAIEFNGEFEEETEICSICGCEAKLTGWNEKKDLSRFECGECNSIYIIDGEGKVTVIKGQKRDWLKYLTENLTFPFDACIDEAQGDGFQEKGPLRYGDKIVVIKTTGEDDLYGVLAEIKKGRKTYQISLSDLAAADENSPNYRTLDDYRTWFANCR